MHSHAFIRTHMPYLLQQTSDGSWIALNRDYLPVGSIAGDSLRANYDDHPSRMRISPEAIKYLRGVTAHLAALGDPRVPGRVYLHMGSLTSDKKSWTAYAKVLKHLASVTYEHDPRRDADRPVTLESDAERQERVERERSQDRQPHQVEGTAVH